MDELLRFILWIAGILIVISYINYRQKMNYIRNNIASSWAKLSTKAYSDQDFLRVSSFYKSMLPKLKYYVDDITWNDLNLDTFFVKINTARTTPGEEYLYKLLRHPLFNLEDLKSRADKVSVFNKQPKIRNLVILELAKLGYHKNTDISSYIINPEKRTKNKLIFYYCMALLPIVSILLAILDIRFLGLFIISMVFNGFTHLFLHRYHSNLFSAYLYIGSMSRYAKRIASIDISEFKDWFIQVMPAIKKINRIKSKHSFIFDPENIGGLVLLMDYLNMIFLVDVINFEKMQLAVFDNQDDFRTVFEFIGEIDSLISIASYKETLSTYCVPEFTTNQNQLNFKNLYHPLIKDPVPNSCNINSSLLITGSNASGKSTFIKSVAINAILSQTFYIALAEQFDTSFYEIYSSMALRDNLLSQESYYIVEIKSLKRILDSLKADIPCLCFIDEILRGTNTIERIAASSEVLYQLSKGNCICLGATHDIELTKILSNHYTNYHFQETIKEGQISFDYKLYDGPSHTRNAIKLLDALGYPNEIVDEANQRAATFVKDGLWNTIPS